MTVRLSGPPRREGLPAVDRRLLRSRASRILRALSRSRAELSVCLVEDAEIEQLNARYRGRRRPTDVLAFSLLEGEGAEHRGRLLGDVVIGIETALRQARARHRALDEELARLLIHGTLHLLGHDHARAEQARAMRAEERRLWRAVREAGR
jgi:probable rRNA maturation factor